MQRPARKKNTISTAEALSQSPKEAILPFNWKWYTLAAGIVAFLLYANTLGHEFTVDDALVTSKNKFTTQGIAGIDEIFSQPYRAGFWDRKESLYRPLSVAMFAIEWQIAGDNPFPGHLINVLLYALTAMLVVSVTRKLLKRFSPLIILAVSFLFIVHPLHTEVIANIKSRDEILCFMLGMLSLLALLKSSEEEQPAPKWMLLSVTAFLFALFSKENALTWLGVFPLALWVTGAEKVSRIVKKMIPFFIAAGVFMVCRYLVLNTMTGDYDLLLINNSLLDAKTGVERFATAVSILGRYILLLIAPVTLAFDYSYNTIPTIGLADMRFIVPFFLLAAGLVYAVKNIAKRDLLSFGILFFMGTIVLVSNIFLLIEATMAERFLYTPSYGFCIVAGIALGKLLKMPARGIPNHFANQKLFTYSVALILVLFSIRTIARNADWKDNYTLLSKDVQANPGSARIRYAFGSALLFEKAVDEKDLQKKNQYLNESVAQLQKGVSIIRTYNDAWFHLGLAHKELGNGVEAVKAFEEARALKEFDEVSKFSNSGVAYGMAGQYEKAIPDLRRAVNMEPDNADHYNNLGLYLSEAGRLNEAITILDSALILKPENEKAFYNKGNTYAKGGQFREAINQYGKALAINPTSTDALNNTGNCYAALNQTDSALVWFQKATEADPYNTKAVTNLGVTYMMLGDTAKGREYLGRANAMGGGL